MLELNPHERSVTAIITTICLSWLFQQERDDLLALLKGELPHVRRSPEWIDLVNACTWLFEARTPIEWADAKAKTSRALLPVIRPDLVARLKKGAA